jgi:hypothetical protein
VFGEAKLVVEEHAGAKHSCGTSRLPLTPRIRFD